MHEFKEHYIYDEAFEGKEMADLRRSDPARYQRSRRERTASSQRRVAEAVAGFANARGGWLYIGVRDGGSVCGPGKDPEYGGFENYPGKLADHMTGSLSRYLRNESFIRSNIRMTFKEFGGRTVCIIRVTMSNRQIYVHPSDKKEMFLARGPGARGKRLEGTERDDYIMGRFGWSSRGLREMAGTRA